MTSKNAIEFDDVHMVFHSRMGRPVQALRGFSLEVAEGAVVGLLGPNGAGKTTSLSCMLGLLRPQLGTIRVRGEVLGRGASLEACGVLLEDTRLPPFLSVKDALATLAALRRIPKPKRRAALDQAIEQTGVKDLLGRDVRALSKGQARRVGLAAALLSDPRVLVLDEPSAGLDPEARVEFDALVRSLRDGQRTLLIASHLLGDVESTCTHIAVVHQGRVALHGRSDNLLAAARHGQAADIHVDASAAATIEDAGMRHTPSSYPGLIRVLSDLPEVEVFATLAGVSVVPRRVEPKASVLSIYLEATKEPS